MGPVTTEERTGRYFLPVLIAGFALLFALLLGSGIVSIDAMRFVESDAARFVAEQQATARLIYEVQSEEGNLSGVFYSLATGRGGADRTLLLQRFDALESAIQRTTSAGAAVGERALWEKVRRAADSFIAEGRDTVLSGRAPTQEFFQRHQKFLAALADLTGSNFAAGETTAEHARLSARVRYSLFLLWAAMAVAVIGAALSVYFANRIFGRLRWQASELANLSSRTMSDQEETARRLSREMHDHFGQTLSAIEANLVAMQNSRQYHSGRIEDCLGLVKDAVGNVREVSQLLRPAILDDFGLSASLRWLAEGFSERTGVQVAYTSQFDGRLDGDIETQLFRIAQEALTNVARHSGATKVRLELTAAGDEVRLSISDNGRGFEEPDPGRGAGLVGMRARARAAGGSLSIESHRGKGASITVSAPVRESVYASQDPNSSGG
jgi:signal transduction histidine kinase